MARRHAAAGSIVLLVLLMLMVMWPQAAAAQDGDQDQANGQGDSAAVSPRLFLPLASNKSQLQTTPDTSIWSDAVAPSGIDSEQRWVVPDTYRLVSANMGRLDTVLAQAPAENSTTMAAASSSRHPITADRQHQPAYLHRSEH